MAMGNLMCLRVPYVCVDLGSHINCHAKCAAVLKVCTRKGRGGGENGIKFDATLHHGAMLWSVCGTNAFKCSIAGLGLVFGATIT